MSSTSSVGSSAPFAISTSCSSGSPARRPRSGRIAARPSGFSRRCDHSETNDEHGSGRRWTTSGTSPCSTASRRQPGSLPATRTDLTVDQLARKELKKLRDFERRTSRDDDRQLHELRIHSKRARYAAELARASRGAPAARFIKAATRLQDVLGEHHDAVVAIAELRRLALLVDSPGDAFTAGRLSEREAQRKLRARQDLPEAWRSLRRRGKEAW